MTLLTVAAAEPAAAAEAEAKTAVAAAAAVAANDITACTYTQGAGFILYNKEMTDR